MKQKNREKKKVIAGILAAVLLLASLCACGTTQTDSSTPASLPAESVSTAASVPKPEPQPEPEPEPEPENTPWSPAVPMPTGEIVPTESVQPAASGYHLIAGGWQNGGGLYYGGQSLWEPVYVSSNETALPMQDLTGAVEGVEELLIPISPWTAYGTFDRDSVPPESVLLRAEGYTLIPSLSCDEIWGKNFHVYKDGKYLFSAAYTSFSSEPSIGLGRRCYVAGDPCMSFFFPASKDEAAEQANFEEFLNVAEAMTVSETPVLRIGSSLQFDAFGRGFATVSAIYDAQTQQLYPGVHQDGSILSGPWYGYSYGENRYAEPSTQPVSDEIQQKGDLVLALSDMATYTQLYMMPLYEQEREWLWGLGPEMVLSGLAPETAEQYTVNGVSWQVIYEPYTATKHGGAIPQPEEEEEESGVNGASSSGWSAYLRCESEPQFAFCVVGSTAEEGDARLEQMAQTTQQVLTLFSPAE